MPGPNIAGEVSALRRIKANQTRPPAISWPEKLKGLGKRGVKGRVPLSILTRMHAALERNYFYKRSLAKYNGWRLSQNLPPVERLIELPGKKKIKLLDAGAGEGLPWYEINAGHFLGDRIKIDYQGVDLFPVEHMEGTNRSNFRKERGRKRVRALDLSSERLPRNNFDVVVSVMVFRYMPDKFRALKNLVDSLNTGGTLAIVDFGDIRIDGEQCDLNRRRDRELFMKIVGEKNPWLDITVTETGGILIKKTRKNESRFDLRFEGSEPCYPDLFSGALELGKMRSSSALLSRYSSR